MMGMVRGATFDMIMSLIGSRSNTVFPPQSRWLDLFAGTGAIGIEAISRGCEQAHFVEMDPWVTGNVLQKNIDTLGVQTQTNVHTTKVETFLAQHKNTARAAGGAFDFVSFCPPYYKVSLKP
jgi:16S rRNA G966 N2-methylase RsmD